MLLSATILRDGRKVATSAVSETSPRALVHAIVGRELEQQSPPPQSASSEVVLEVEELAAGHVGPVSFTLGPGEILGWSGCAARAMTRSAGCCSGRRRPKRAGSGLREGCRPVQTEGALRRTGSVSSKRREENLAPSLTVRDNFLFMNPALWGAAACVRSGVAARSHVRWRF